MELSHSAIYAHKEKKMPTRQLSIPELLDSLLALTQELYSYERAYNLASEDFYKLFSQGKLDDGEVEQTEDFCLWAGLYETKLAREQALRQASHKTVQRLLKTSESGKLRLSPQMAM